MKFGKSIWWERAPEDPELLTLKAVKAMRAADVLLVDDLPNEEVLAFAAPDARIIYLGKRGGCTSIDGHYRPKTPVKARQFYSFAIYQTQVLSA